MAKHILTGISIQFSLPKWHFYLGVRKIFYDVGRGTGVGRGLGVMFGLAVGVGLAVAVGVLVGVVLGVIVGVTVAVAVGVALGVTLAVAVGDGDTVGVAVGVAVGVHGGPWHQLTSTVSTRHPSLEPPISLAIRQRNLPSITSAGRYTTVVMKPPELPLHA